jgi:hypothetical protein
VLPSPDGQFFYDRAADLTIMIDRNNNATTSMTWTGSCVQDNHGCALSKKESIFFAGRPQQWRGKGVLEKELCERAAASA